MKLKQLLTEAKQVGILYHYTKIARLESILQSNKLKVGGEDFPRDYNFISFTRNKNLHKDVTGKVRNGVHLQCRILIDGDKLSNKYKIRPYNYWASDDGWMDNDQARSEDTESEERLSLGKNQRIDNLSKYVIEYQIIKSKLKPEDTELAKEFATNPNYPNVGFI